MFEFVKEVRRLVNEEFGYSISLDAIDALMPEGWKARLSSSCIDSTAESIIVKLKEKGYRVRTSA